MNKGLLLILPVIILVLTITVVPMVNMVYRSLQKTMFGFGESEFVGLENYIHLFTEDEDFLPSLFRSFLWVAENLAIQLTVPLLIALLLQGSSLFNQISRTLILIPWILPMVVISIIWRWLLEPNVGYIGYLMRILGLKPLNFFGSKELAFHTLVFINSWHFIPFGTILMIAALATIPEDLYDAAKVDGANSIQRFVHITFPLLGKTVWFVGLLAFMWSFNTFDLIWLITQGGPADSTLTLPVYIYKLAFKMYNYGKASAASVISTAILLFVAYVYFKIFTPRKE